MMTPKEQLLFRVGLLKALRAAGTLGEPESRLLLSVKEEGFPFSAPQFRVELQTLADAGWISGRQPPLGGDMRWRITALGEDLLVEQTA
ncbi:MAG: hypothetical protein HY302_09340 [Opitutae bacterium]|nr:hypothetical protein [Opitutae bacterium]